MRWNCLKYEERDGRQHPSQFNKRKKPEFTSRKQEVSLIRAGKGIKETCIFVQFSRKIPDLSCQRAEMCCKVPDFHNKVLRGRHLCPWALVFDELTMGVTLTSPAHWAHLCMSGMLLRNQIWGIYICSCTSTSAWRSCSADAYCQKYCDDFRSAFRGISDLYFLRGANVSSGTWRSQASITFLVITKPRLLTARMSRGFCTTHESSGSWDAAVSVYEAVCQYQAGGHSQVPHILSRMFVEAVWPPRCLILYTQGRWCERNTLIPFLYGCAFILVQSSLFESRIGSFWS